MAMFPIHFCLIVSDCLVLAVHRMADDINTDSMALDTWR